MKLLLALAALLALLTGASVYTLDATEVAVVTAFGRPVRTVLEPGLHLRAPWPLHQVVRYDRRARLLAVEPAEVLTRDKKNLVVEAFVVWRIEDPETFLEAVRTIQAAETQLADLAVSRIAAAIGQRDFGELFAVEGSGDLLPADLAPRMSRRALEHLGTAVLDVRVRHLGLPMQNEQSIYERMRAERQRIARAYRSAGEEKAATIRAEADRQAQEILARAEQDAAAIRAEAEATAARLYAETWREDPAFYGFLRRLDALEAALGEDDLVVLSTDDPVLGLLAGGEEGR